MYLFWIILGIVYVIYRVCKDEGIGDTSQPYLKGKDTLEEAHAKFLKYGYGDIRTEAIKKVIHTHTRTPLKNAFDAMCFNSNLKLNSMTIQELSELAGFDVNELPIDEKSKPPYSHTKRYELVREYIMKRDYGLKYSRGVNYGVYTDVTHNDTYSMDLRELIPTLDKEKVRKTWW